MLACGSSRRSSSFRSRAIRCSAPRSSSPRAATRRRHGCETGLGAIPVALTRRGRPERSCSARWSSGSPSQSRSIAPTRYLRALGCRALGAADRGLPQRTAVRIRRARRRGSRRGPVARISARCRRSGRSASTVSPAAGTRVKTRMFGPGLGVAEDPATGSAAGPLALHLVRHGRSEFGAADRDPSGRRDRAAIADLRARRGLTASGSSGSPSAALR